MMSAVDTGANMQHIHNKSEPHAPSPKYHNPITSAQLKDLPRLEEDYSHDNPEPPAWKL